MPCTEWNVSVAGFMEANVSDLWLDLLYRPRPIHGRALFKWREEQVGVKEKRHLISMEGSDILQRVHITAGLMTPPILFSSLLAYAFFNSDTRINRTKQLLKWFIDQKSHWNKQHEFAIMILGERAVWVRLFSRALLSYLVPMNLELQ